jgi:hypothetical protein
MPDTYRSLTADERAIFDRLMEVPFEGRTQAVEQLKHLTVRPARGCEEHCGSLELAVDLVAPPIPHKGELESKLDPEGWSVDADGFPVEILLSQKHGRLSFLEFVVYSDHLKRRPRAADIKVGPVPESEARDNVES